MLKVLFLFFYLAFYNSMKEKGRGANKANSSFNSNSGIKRTVVPNIAAAASRILAPKWADSKPNASDAAVKSERLNGESSTVKKEGGRGRPRGRGRGRGSSTKSFVASEGVFSQGIGEDVFGSQRTRGLRLKNAKDEEIIGKLDNSLHENASDDKQGNKKLDREKTHKEKKIKLEPSTSENHYEEFWQSDDELDNEELDELCGGSFIADLKKCEQLPFVLPNNEAQQFNQIIKKRRKEEEQGQYTFKDVKDIKISKELSSVEYSSGRMEGCLKNEKFQFAANTIQRIANDNDLSDQLILFQLPSVPLMRIAETQKQQKQILTENEQKIGDEKRIILPPEKPINNFSAQNRSSSTQEPQLQQKNCLETLSSGGGTRIGKLQFLRSGKAVLNIGGHQMDISESISSECFETLLRVEVAGEQQQCSKDNNLCGYPFGLNNGISSSLQKSTSGYGSAHLLGSLPFHFVCSFDIKRALETTNNNNT